MELIAGECNGYGYRKLAKQLQLEYERTPPRTPNMNVLIESFYRILEDDCMSRFEFETYGKAYKEITGFMDFYNNRRIHSSILDLDPNEFYKLERGEQIRIKEIRV